MARTAKYILYAATFILFVVSIKIEFEKKESLEKYFEGFESEKSLNATGEPEDPFAAIRYRAGILKDKTGKFDPSMRMKAIEFSKANLEKKKGGNEVQRLSEVQLR